MQTDITNGNILKVNGYPIKKGTKPYDLFFPFIFGTAGEDYERGKNSIIFKVFNKPNDENYYSKLPDKSWSDIDAAKYIQDSDDYNENLSFWEQSKKVIVENQNVINEKVNQFMI